MRSRTLHPPLALWCSCSPAPAFAQQTGSVSGIVQDEAAPPLPGVTVTGKGPMLPGGPGPR